MKKLLIKVVCIITVVMTLLCISVGCNDGKETAGDTVETLGVILVTEATPDQATIAPTTKPTETIKPTEAKPSATVAPTETPEVEITEDYSTKSYDDEDYVDTDTSSNSDLETETETENEKEEEEEDSYTPPSNSSSYIYNPYDFLMSGIIDWGGWTWTYYSEKILPGYGLYLPGRYTDENGYICDGDGYICLASSSLAWGTVVDTPFGKQGKVYDSGCAGYILDVYVSW